MVRAGREESWEEYKAKQLPLKKMHVKDFV